MPLDILAVFRCVFEYTKFTRPVLRRRKGERYQYHIPKGTEKNRVKWVFDMYLYAEPK